MDDISVKIASLRWDYMGKELDENTVLDSPIRQFEAWMKEALDAGVAEPNATSLATISAQGRPTVRIVLLRGFNVDGFVFFTNYRSRKGTEMEQCPFGALNFFWPELGRQIRVEGRIEKISSGESDEYFKSRPRDSQIGAWASDQSQAILSRKELEKKVDELTEQYKDKEVPRPAHWGGYRIIPDYLEFWQGRLSRLHDRICYKLEKDGKWSRDRIAP